MVDAGVAPRAYGKGHGASGGDSARGDAASDDVHRVTQVYCSAVPVGYAKGTPSTQWAPLASMILLGSYEATFAAAAIVAKQRGCRVKLVLTKVGGGVFGNRSNWIIEAIQHSIEAFRRIRLMSSCCTMAQRSPSTSRVSSVG